MSINNLAYIAKQVDKNHCAQYTQEEDSIWQILISRQIPLVKTHACDTFIQGLQVLELPMDRIAQCPEVNAILQKTTGWSLYPVPSIIQFEEFFRLLSEKKFPAATFIRRADELDYLKEPDIFHEIFGHCPMMMNETFTDFMQKFGFLGLKANNAERKLLARLYWFTVEFGLIKSDQSLKIYGGGILSSFKETQYCLENKSLNYRLFNPIDVLRTPYRYDVLQTSYFFIESFDELYKIMDLDLLELVRKAKKLGDFSV